jgi:hypothetical protein
MVKHTRGGARRSIDLESVTEEYLLERADMFEGSSPAKTGTES